MPISKSGGNSKTTAGPAERFAAIMWDLFLDGGSVDGADLQDALEKSGMAERRPATAQDIAGSVWDGEIEVGDDLTFLTDSGKTVVKAGGLADVKST